MNKSELDQHLQEVISSIDLCFKERKIAPTLILLYSTIDIMAWLDRDINHDDVKRSDFLSWVDTYISSASSQHYQAIDLYAARCSLLHSYTSQSKLSRDGDATELFYAWGTGDENKLQQWIDQANIPNAKSIKLDLLISDLKSAINDYLLDKGNDQIVLNRAGKFFSNIPV